MTEDKQRPVIVINARLIFLVLALICFLIKAFAIHTADVDCFYLGLAFVVASWIF